MSKYRLGCCIPGASFMPEGEAGASPQALETLTRGSEVILSSGFDYAEAGVGMIMLLPERELAAAGKLGIEACNSFIPPAYAIVKDGACEPDSPLMKYVSEALYRMREIGVGTVVFGSGGARRIQSGMDKSTGVEYITRFLSACAPICAEYGVSIAIEPLRRAECNAINYTYEAEAMADAVKSEYITYLADAFHMAWGDESADALLSAPTLPSHIHISQAPDRTYPGSGDGKYLSEFAAALKKTEYGGRISVECGFSDFRRECALAYEFTSKLY